HKQRSTMATSAPRLAGGQTAIPYALMRGGTSRGPMFLATDLPADQLRRDSVLLAVLGSPHPLQVDGVGGGHPLTSKAGIVAVSEVDDVDIDFTVAQLQPEATTVQTTANIGNMLAAVVPFAVEIGLRHPQSDSIEAIAQTHNTGLVSRIVIRTAQRDGERIVQYDSARERGA